MKSELSLVCLLLAVPAASLAQGPQVLPAAPHCGPLGADKIQAIQAIGQATLTAKQSESPSAAEQRLGEEMQLLRTHLDQALIVSPSVPPSLSAAAPAANLAPSAIAADPRADALRPHLAALHALGAELQSSPSEEAHATRLASLAALVSDAEGKLGAALAVTGTERFVQLTALRASLEPKGASDLAREHAESRRQTAIDRQDAAEVARTEPTPTLTTIIRHRLDEAKAKESAAKGDRR